MDQIVVPKLVPCCECDCAFVCGDEDLYRDEPRLSPDGLQVVEHAPIEFDKIPQHSETVLNEFQCQCAASAYTTSRPLYSFLTGWFQLNELYYWKGV